MPIRPHLHGQEFDPETLRVMGLAFEMALIALRLADRGDLANEILAHKIVELAKCVELWDGARLIVRFPSDSG